MLAIAVPDYRLHKILKPCKLLLTASLASPAMTVIPASLVLIVMPAVVSLIAITAAVVLIAIIALLQIAISAR